MFHQETCLIKTKASPEALQVTHRQHRHDSFIIPAFISPGLSGIIICPASSAPDLLTDSRTEKKNNQKKNDGTVSFLVLFVQKDLEEFQQL